MRSDRMGTGESNVEPPLCEMEKARNERERERNAAAASLINSDARSCAVVLLFSGLGLLIEGSEFAFKSCVNEPLKHPMLCLVQH